jgi:hypothetical protein
MRNVYVIGAYLPYGGAFIAYHLGLIVSEYIDGEPVAVRVADENPQSGVFEYPREISTVNIEQFKEIGKPSDVLIMNPSFSDLWLGPHFNGYKLMYMQGFNTFAVLDRWFDSYVSVSEYVSGFLKYVYGVNSPVIPPFVDLATASTPRQWEERPENKVLVVTKGNSMQQGIIYERIKQRVLRDRSDIVFDLVPGRMKHEEFLSFIAGYRYVLSLSCAEGFGLIPLESMGLGATIVAFDAGGGRSYMVEGGNCWCTSYPNVELLADHLLHALNNPDEALKIAQNGIRQAKMFNYERFRESWMSHLRGNLNLK